MNFSLGKLNVAHLVGLDRRAKKTADDDEEMKPEGERCEDDEEAEAGEAEEEASAEGDGKGGKKSKKSKKSKKEEDDTSGDDENDDEDELDDEDDDKEKKAEARGRKAERARCAEIMTSEAASNNIALAAELAFGTNLSAKKAIAVLGKGGSTSGLSQRMAGQKQPDIGSGDGKSGRGKDAIASSWDRAAAPFMPKK